MKKLALLLCLLLVSCAIGPGEATGRSRENIEVSVTPAADYKVVLYTQNVVVASANTGAGGVVKFNNLPIGAYKAVVYDSTGVKLPEKFFTSTYVSGPTPFKVFVSKAAVQVPAIPPVVHTLSIVDHTPKLKDSYVTNEIVKTSVKAVEDGSPASIDKGYVVFYRFFDSRAIPKTITPVNDMSIQSAFLNNVKAADYYKRAVFNPTLGYWDVSTNTPPTPGPYYLHLIVLCFEPNSVCWNDPARKYLYDDYIVDVNVPAPLQVCTNAGEIICNAQSSGKKCEQTSAGLVWNSFTCPAPMDMCVIGKGCVECVANSECASGKCQNNVCVSPVCKDPDQTAQLTYKTTVTRNGESCTDECLNERTVKECTCTADGRIESRKMECSYACKDGLCLQCMAGKVLCADEKTVLTCNAQGFDVLTECEKYARYCVDGFGCGACRSDGDCSANAKCNSVTHACELPQYATVPLFACRRDAHVGDRTLHDYYVDTNAFSPCPNGGPIGILGRIISPNVQQPAGTVRLVYCYWPNKDDHLIAEDFCDPVTQHRAFLGYVYKNQESGTVPLSRCTFNANGEHTQVVGLCPAGTGWEGTWHMLPACTETDRGKDINRKGVVDTMGFDFIFKKYAAEDYCVDSNTVREYYCDTGRFDVLSTSQVIGIGRALNYEDIKCAQGCSNGACISGEAPGITSQVVLSTQSSGSSNLLVVFIAAFGILVVTLLNFLHKEE